MIDISILKLLKFYQDIDILQHLNINNLHSTCNTLSYMMNVFLKFSNSSSVIFTEYWNKVAVLRDLKAKKLLMKTFSVAGIMAEQVLQAKQILQAAAWKEYHSSYNLSKHVNLWERKTASLSNMLLSNIFIIALIICHNSSSKCKADASWCLMPVERLSLLL